MAIISVLASMLLPALGKARAAAHATACANNLKTLSAAGVLYTGDEDGFAVPSHWRRAVDTIETVTWDDRLGDYDGRSLSVAKQELYHLNYTIGTQAHPGDGWRLYQCPSDLKKVESDGMPANYATHDPIARSYATNEYVHRRYSSVVTGFPLQRISYWRDPAVLLDFMERPTMNVGGTTAYAYLGHVGGSVGGARTSGQFTYAVGYYPGGIHAFRFNYAFVDGHVERTMPASVDDFDTNWAGK